MTLVTIGSTTSLRFVCMEDSSSKQNSRLLVYRQIIGMIVAP